MPTATNPTNPTIARLVALCDESGLTRADIAERAGINASYLTRLLKGECDPSSARLKAILDAIGCTWGDLDEQPAPRNDRGRAPD